jgi:hypothetical protein
MVGTVLIYRDDGVHPYCVIALGNGDRVQLSLDADGLVIDRLAFGDTENETVFCAPIGLVSKICAGLVGPKTLTDAPPLRILAATVQRIGSAEDVRAAFTDAMAELI